MKTEEKEIMDFLRAQPNVEDLFMSDDETQPTDLSSAQPRAEDQHTPNGDAQPVVFGTVRPQQDGGGTNIQPQPRRKMEVHQVIKKSYPDYQWEEPAPPHVAAPSATKDPDQLNKNDWKDFDMKTYVALAWYWAQTEKGMWGENRRGRHDDMGRAGYRFRGGHGGNIEAEK